MYEDLYLAAALLTIATLALFTGTVVIARRLPSWMGDGLAAIMVIVMGYYIRDVMDNISLARWLPVSSLIILGNWFPFGIAILAGVAWQRVPPPVFRKLFIVLLLGLTATYAVYYPFQGEVPHCLNKWRGGVCLQTTQATCSAAAAATLLKLHGIEADEQELANLCITRKGTTWLGLFRGLKLKTAGTPWDVEVFASDASQLERMEPGGAIIFVRLTADQAELNPELVTEEGWIPGQSHSVVLLEFLNSGGGSNCLVGDPSSGVEAWPVEDLRMLYEGRGMRLVKRAE